MKIRFRIRTALICIGLIGLILASWVWTDTVGVEHLKNKYDADARECVRHGLEKDNLGISVDEFLDSTDTSHYFENPRAIFPFIISVDTDESFSGHYGLQGVPGIRRTHLWFFGYVSEAL